MSENIAVSERMLVELLPYSLTSAPCVSIISENKVWVAAAMLVHHLESFTDSLVVTDKNHKPIGQIGGKDVIEGLLKNPTSDFFDNTRVADIMDLNLVNVSETTRLKELLERWMKTHRAFSMLPNHWKGYSAVSARKLLEVAMGCKTNTRISNLPKKNIVTFQYDDSIKNILESMLENKTRKLVFKNTHSFVSDRIIIQQIAQDFDYLRKTNNFLDKKFDDPFKLADAKVVSEDLTLPELARLMYGMFHPYVFYKDQVVSPWDICMELLSDNLTEYKYFAFAE